MYYKPSLGVQPSSVRGSGTSRVCIKPETELRAAFRMLAAGAGFPAKER